jgi:hypothetical protein
MHEPFEDTDDLVTPTPSKVDLRDVHAVRRELGSVYRDMRAGRVKTQDGTRLAYVLDMIRKAYETGELQNRMMLLEQALRIREKKK